MKVTKLQPHSFLTKDPVIKKTAHSTIKAVYTISNRKHPDQEKTFQNIYFKDPRAIKGGKAKAQYRLVQISQECD